MLWGIVVMLIREMPRLFNFVIAKLTPIMLSDITYGTFLLFGSCCILMVVYTIFCVPETKNVPLESIHLLFEGNIIKGAVRDTVPRHSRARVLQHRGEVEGDEVRAGKDADADSARHVEGEIGLEPRYFVAGLNNGGRA